MVVLVVVVVKVVAEEVKRRRISELLSLMVARMESGLQEDAGRRTVIGSHMLTVYWLSIRIDMFFFLLYLVGTNITGTQ